ncbi:hypothetical protein Fcan01_03568 [Folsomia candida]|uniref:Uncharacterized protein n=1 Tax=Folsomia candida TaxID=158441 RepID=A0A226EZK1_FOLCA|nr:hypothetical protein Fcan01_03568 [Folsomia candida]
MRASSSFAKSIFVAGAGRHSRHTQCNDIIKRALISADIPSIREPLGCCRTDGKRPDGLTLIPYKQGRSLIWDFTCTDTFAPSYLSHTLRHAGTAAKLAETKKHKLYSELEKQYIFVPVAVETSGVWGMEGLKFIQDVGRRMKDVTGPMSTTFLIQRISLAVQRGNAASIMGAVPSQRGLEELFYILNDRSFYLQKSCKGPNGDLGRLSGSSKGFPNPPTSGFSSTPQAN